MMFQIFATIVLFCIAVYAYAQSRVSPYVTRIAILVTILGEYLVLVPDHATSIASLFGVGRGADLIFYVWVLLSMIMVLNVHIRLRGLNDRLIALTRELALRDAADAARRLGARHPRGRCRATILVNSAARVM